jgi:hypothetical protein
MMTPLEIIGKIHPTGSSKPWLFPDRPPTRARYEARRMREHHQVAGVDTQKNSRHCFLVLVIQKPVRVTVSAPSRRQRALTWSMIGTCSFSGSHFKKCKPPLAVR